MHWIPQGSILGPILFLIYINDLPESCDISSYDVNLIYLYADDAKVYKTIKNSEDNKTLQAVVNKIREWSDKWSLKLNIGKCKVMSYSMREHIQTQYFIYDDNNEYYLENLNVYKDLGVIFDSRLSFREHIQEKIEKAYKMLGIIKRNFIHFSSNTFIQLHKSIVRPHLDYANSVWHPYKVGDIEDIEKVQKRAVGHLIKETSI